MKTLNKYQQWIELKKMESELKEKRFALENEIAQIVGYNPLSGKSTKKNDEDFEIKFTPSKARKVDYDKLKEIQQVNQIPQTEIEKIFRFNVLLNVSEYNQLPEYQQKILEDCITLQINKPTLKITPLEENK